jgi:phage regulator Rha-like protein
MDTALEISVNDGEYCLDSRVLAKRLGYEHHTVTRNIQRHRARLEARSILRQNVEKINRGRGRSEVYYLLNERQSLILVGSLKKGEEAEEWHDALVDAFLQARNRVNQMEAAQARSAQEQLPFNWLLHKRLKLFIAGTRLHPGSWCVFKEVACYAYLYPALIEAALPDGSVGRRWMAYVRQHPEKFDVTLIQSYGHRYPDKRGTVPANQYPNAWLAEFRLWFEETYLKEYLQHYVAPRVQALPQAGNQGLLPGAEQ